MKNLNKKIKTLTTKEEMKTLVTNAELQAEQDKTIKLPTYDLSLFVGQSYFNHDGSKLYLIFHPIQKAITSLSGFTYKISEWESKGLPNEKFTLC